MEVEARLKQLGLVIPPAPKAAANYAPYVRQGGLVYVSGQGPFGSDGKLKYVGKVGQELTERDGYESARLCALNGLAQVRAALGSLDRVQQVVRVAGLVNCGPDFAASAQVINGASDLLVEIFGEQGRHARMASGAVTLPFNVATLVEMIVAVD